MAEPKYRCPYCGCKKLVFSRETITKTYYRVNDDGTPFTNPVCSVENYSDFVEEYYDCQECNHGVNIADGVELKKWENPQEAS